MYTDSGIFVEIVDKLIHLIFESLLNTFLISFSSTSASSNRCCSSQGITFTSLRCFLFSLLTKSTRLRCYLSFVLLKLRISHTQNKHTLTTKTQVTFFLLRFLANSISSMNTLKTLYLFPNVSIEVSQSEYYFLLTYTLAKLSKTNSFH